MTEKHNLIVVGLQRAIIERRPAAVIKLYSSALRQSLRRPSTPTPEWDRFPQARDYFCQGGA